MYKYIHAHMYISSQVLKGALEHICRGGAKPCDQTEVQLPSRPLLYSVLEQEEAGFDWLPMS